ncbi:MAG: DUF5615 family PIN-like protein [Acidobacteria bacterium]|nr:DUF5615 family PIN-like protein [Acidobacteriota bacterium]
MKLLLDECVTRLVRRDFVGHDVYTVDEAGFKGLKNGALLRRAVSDNFEVLITVDQNLAHQQNVKSSGVAVLILVARRNTYEALKPVIPEALEVLDKIRPGEIVRVKTPGNV